MSRRAATKGLGKALEADQKKHLQKARDEAARSAAAAGSGGPKSVLEQSNLDELIATVELKKKSYAEAVGDADFAEEGPVLVSAVPRAQAELAASERRRLVPIPRRPAWSEGMSSDELAVLEADAFLEWRRGLAAAAQEEGLHLTPYEKNLDFWRQLWRCVERSDLIVQIVDARDPDFFYCHDLHHYVSEVSASKKLLLLVNKSDFLPAALRQQWTSYFASCGVEAVFFSALYELQKQQKQQLTEQREERRKLQEEPNQGEDSEDVDGEDEEDEEEEEEEDEEPRGNKISSRWQLLAQTEEDEEDEDEDENEGDEGRGQEVKPSRPANSAAAEVDPAAVPVPDSSDDELADRADATSLTGDKDHPARVEDDEEETPLGPSIHDGRGIVTSSALLDELIARLAPQSAEGRRGTIGFVGYPNVGKSTVINALLGTKKVGMSRTPGKTKHIQTIELSALGVTLCDCPGLVFPSVAASRAHLVINNTVHLDDLRECLSPVALIVDKIGLSQLLQTYGCTSHLKSAREATGSGVLGEARSFLAALAVSRGHTLRARVPDEDWAARKVLRDYVTGRLLHCELPPGTQEEAEDKPEVQEEGSSIAEAGAPEEPASQAGEQEDDDFGDVKAFLEEVSTNRRLKKMTKREMRFMNKQALRGKPRGKVFYETVL